jgi:hypothetical protein
MRSPACRPAASPAARSTAAKPSIPPRAPIGFASVRPPVAGRASAVGLDGYGDRDEHVSRITNSASVDRGPPPATDAGPEARRGRIGQAGAAAVDREVVREVAGRRVHAQVREPEVVRHPRHAAVGPKVR